MVIALAVAYLILRPGLRLDGKSWLAIHVRPGLMLAPWVLHYFDHKPQEFPRPLTARLLLEWPEGFTGGNSEAAAVGVALVIFGCVAGRGWKWGGSDEDEKEASPVPFDRTTAALLVWFLVPPALLILYTMTRHPIFGERRYLLFVGPAYLILAARGLSMLPARPRIALLLAFLFFNVQALDRRVFRIYRPDVRAAAALAEENDPSAPIVVVDDHRNNFFKCLLTYRNPTLKSPVVSVREALRAWKSGEVPQAEAVWFAMERPKGLPYKPLPDELSRIYATEKTFEFDLSDPHLQP